MKKTGLISSLLFLIVSVIAGCKEHYDAPVHAQQTNFLVVEGFINATGSSRITLSRSSPLKDTSAFTPENNAQVEIQGEDNSVYNVYENQAGVYISNLLNLNGSQKYRLHIKAAGKDYLSAFVPVKITPPIDSISWRSEDEGVRIYISTHDPQNNSRYYKWDYEETWEIHSAFVNRVKYLNGTVGNRDPGETDRLYRCWVSHSSSDIVTGSSEKLVSDVISEARVVFVPAESEKTSVRYSILVKQYALDLRAYNFYQLLKSNTESLGSVFDRLPSEITGNISCASNPSEKVIGYISSATIEEKRIFISAGEIRSAYSSNCSSVYVKNNPDTLRLYYEGLGYQPYQPDPAGFGPVLGYFSSLPRCVDCTTRGSDVRPSFW